LRAAPVRRAAGHHRGRGSDGAAAGAHDDPAIVVLLDPLDGRVGMENAAFGFDDRRQTPQIFEGVKGPLLRVTQHMLAFAMPEGNADEAVNRRADLANRVQFVVDDLRIGIERLKQVAVEAAEIAIDLLPLLDFFDAVDRRCLAFIKQTGGFFAAQADHRRRQIVAQRREMRAGAGGDAAGDLAAIDDDDPPAFGRELVGGGNACDT